MSSLSLRLPDSLHAKIRELAARDDISINQFIATAVAEKAAALLTLEYIAARGKRGRRSSLDRILKNVPRVPPIPGDEIEDRNAAARPSKRMQPSRMRRGPSGAKRRKPKSRPRG